MARIYSSFLQQIVSEDKVVATIETPQGPLVLTAKMAEHLDDYPQWQATLEEMSQTLQAAA